MSENYDSDDLLPQSPKLQAIKVRATPSPSPPPFISKQPLRPLSENSGSHSSRRRHRGREVQPSLGDAVLVSFMGPNNPDIARTAGEKALKPLDSPSQSEASDSEEDMEGPVKDLMTGPVPTANGITSHELPLAQVALAALAASKVADQMKESGADSTATSLPTPDGPVDNRLCDGEQDNHKADVEFDAVRGAKSTPPAAHPSNTSSAQVDGVDGYQTVHMPKGPKNEFMEADGEASNHLLNGHPREDSVAISPNLRAHLVAKGSPRTTLPALQNPTPQSQDDPTSPTQERLPPFKHLSELAEAATNEQEARANVIHRHSFSSATGPPSHSPTMLNRHYSSGQPWSPPSQFPPLSHVSPVSQHSEASPHDASVNGMSPQRSSSYFGRRPSHVSDSGRPFPPTLHSASTNGSYASTDGCSPPQSTPGDYHRMSIDENSRILPLPHVSLAHVPPHGMHGGFKCEFLGCNAPPFQTQYLLNSHANVHSSNRPHYCPVPNCPRGEGGKGFKRKNEMIRHGLVHDSPGYVCPFCPDREHKYPRPDNLQRHVRVHHMDKDKDDPLLREVLAQRPEGGNRGRRRRAGS